MTTVSALPPAPPVTRAAAAPLRRRRLPAIVLLLVGVLLALGPFVGGLFAKTASAQQMIDAFSPHLQASALDQYEADLDTLRTGSEAVKTVYAQQGIAGGRFAGLDDLRAQADGIDRRASALLATIRASAADYRTVADIGGFDRAPFLLVASGIALVYAGWTLYGGSRRRAGGAVALALVAGIALIGYPVVAQLPEGTRAGARMQDALAPVMTTATVQAEQRDFVVLVHAVGELDTTFRSVAVDRTDRRALDALVAAWPQVSSDLAALVGTLNDNLANDRALADLDALGDPFGVSGLEAFPWFLIGAGAIAVVAATAAHPSLRRTTQEYS